MTNYQVEGKICVYYLFHFILYYLFIYKDTHKHTHFYISEEFAIIFHKKIAKAIIIFLLLFRITIIEIIKNCTVNRFYLVGKHKNAMKNA